MAGADAPGASWTVPELGPSLGRLTDAPSGAEVGPLGARLDDIRLRLVTGIFDLAGAGRSFAAAGDPAGAMTSLNRLAWLGLWEKAVAAAAERVTTTVNARLREAAAESRYPQGKLRQALLTAGDTRAIAARLGGGGGPFVAALDELEHAMRDALAWPSALAAAARRLEAAWLALEQAATAEQLRWQADVGRVRAWRLPRWPLWLISALVLGAALYLGLVLGGYIDVPPPLRGFAEYWWRRL